MVRIKYRKEPLPSPEQTFDRGKGGATDAGYRDALDFDDVALALKRQKIIEREQRDKPIKKPTLPDANFIEQFMGRKK